MGGALDLLLISFTVFALCSSILSSPPPSSSSSSIYDVLSSNALPTGLLPKGITNFTFDQITGRFQVRLGQPCYAKFETDFHYEWNISGTIGYGKIIKFSGVSAQDLFLWFPIKGVRVDVPSSGLIYFDVGVIRKQFSLSFFETPVDCTATNSSSPPPDLVSFNFNDDRPIVQNQFGRLDNEVDGDIELRSVS